MNDRHRALKKLTVGLVNRWSRTENHINVTVQ